MVHATCDQILARLSSPEAGVVVSSVDVQEVDRLARRVEAVRLALVAVADRQQVHRRCGHSSTSAWMARFADKAMTSLLLRRHQFGHRRRDVPLSIALSPVHVVTAALAAVLGGLLPVLVGVAMVFCVALALAAATGGAPTPVHPLGLGVGAVASLLMAWWGPGGASLRRGSRSMVRGVVRAGLMTDVVVGMLVAASLALAVWAFVRGGAVLWWPLSSAPGFLGPLPTGR